MSEKTSTWILWTTIGRKVLLALSGLALFFFLIFHLLGNFTLFVKDPGIFNQYAYTLERMGFILYVMEGLLILTFLVHILDAIFVTLENRKARSSSYYKEGNAGKPSRKSLSSKTMIYTGLLVFAFVVFHVKMFKYGAHYVAQNSNIRDLHRLVVECFKTDYIVISYCIAMILLGLHLRHAFFSAFQSLGIAHPKYTPYIEKLGILFAIAIAGGFLSIPVWIYFH
ncbi:MAG: succinate dehydrogenase cytochrome b subunit [Candidatus Brocadiae bacterium]|nr:succinate dehydrogenase cytochrome b subunit [Candidatus Brocadiia bacterium]